MTQTEARQQLIDVTAEVLRDQQRGWAGLPGYANHGPTTFWIDRADLITPELVDATLANPIAVLQALGGSLAGMDRRMRTPLRQSSWLFPFGAELYREAK